MASARPGRPDVDGLPDIADPGVWERQPPHATFAWLRAHDPVAWWPLGDGDGFWAVTLHQDVVAVTRDVAAYSSRGGVISFEDLPAEQAEARRTMLEEDPPRHTALRALVGRDLLPRQIARREGPIRELVAATIGQAADGGPVEAVAAISRRAGATCRSGTPAP